MTYRTIHFIYFGSDTNRHIGRVIDRSGVRYAKYGTYVFDEFSITVVCVDVDSSH